MYFPNYESRKLHFSALASEL